MQREVLFVVGGVALVGLGVGLGSFVYDTSPTISYEITCPVTATQEETVTGSVEVDSGDHIVLKCNHED